MYCTTIPYKNIILFLLFLCCRVLFAQTAPPPVIYSFAPLSGPVDTTVAIEGDNFSPDPASNIVYFGAVQASIVSATTTALEVKVPAGATYQPITVTTNHLTAYSNTFFNVTFPSDGSGITTNTFVRDTMHYQLGSPGDGLSVAISDLNNDSKADIIVTTGDASQTFINTSNPGMISLQKGQDITAGSFPLFTATGDLNGDGKQDVAVVNLFSNTVSVSQNISENGNFALSYIGDFATSLDPSSAVIADLDGDGKPELVVTSFDSVSIFKNTSNGDIISFSDRQDLAIGSISGKISIVDLDYDNQPELIISSKSQVLVARLLYDGRFIVGDVSHFDVPGEGGDTYLGDIDGDGKQDVVVNTGNSQAVLLNQSSVGSISFLTPATVVETGSYVISLSDMDGDGKADLCTLGLEGLSIYKNESDKGQVKINKAITYNDNSFAGTTGDIDGDGKADIIGGGSTDEFNPTSISIWRNTGTEPQITFLTPTVGSSGTQVTITGRFLNSISQVSFGGTPAASFKDIDDTSIIATVGNGSSGSVLVQTNYGQAVSSGTFIFLPPPQITSFSPTRGSPGTQVTITGTFLDSATLVSFGGTPATITFNNDTTIIATIGNGSTGSVLVQTSNGVDSASEQFTFIPPPVIYSLFPLSGPVDTTVTIEGDNFSTDPASNIVYFGAVQASVISATTTTLTVKVPAGATYQPITVTTNHLTAYSNTSFNVTFPTDGSGLTASTFVKDTIDYPTYGNEGNIAISDLNNDSLADILVRTINGGQTFINKSSPKKISLQQGQDALGENTDFSITGDFNGDGKQDIVVNSYLDGVSTISVYRNISENGSFALDSAVNLVAGNFPYSAAIADLDADGKPDLIVTGSESISIFRNRSIGDTILFAEVQDLQITSQGRISIIDLDNDNRPELLTVNDAGIVVWHNLSNTGEISFNPSNYFSTSLPFGDTYVGDLDGDGKQDILVSNGSSVAVLLNNSSNEISFITPAFVLDSISSVASLSDVDGDGRVDLCALNDPGISIYRNESSIGNITFDTAVMYSPEQYPNSMIAGDVDGDGKPDLVVVEDTTDGEGGFLSVWRNTGTEPQITDFTPKSGTIGTADTIRGRFLSSATTVSFGGTNATITYKDDSTIIATVGEGTTGSVLVQTLYGADSVSTFTYNLPPPQITSFSPDSGTLGTSDTIRGRFLSNATLVSFGGTPATSITLNDDTTIIATVGNGSTGIVFVQTANGVDSMGTFIYSPPPPQILSFTPDSGSVDTTVTITGMFFTGAVQVSFGGTNAASFTINNDSTITAIVGRGSTGNIVVETPYGTDTTTGQFTYNLPPPLITSFSPDSGTLGTTDTIRGRFLTDATLVSFGGTPAAIVLNNDTAIIATVGNGSSGNVLVTTAGGVDSMGTFTYTPPAPIITSFTPDSGSPGREVTITGSFLDSATLVSFGGTPATIKYNSEDTIFAIVGNGSTGSVLVQTRYGVDSTSEQFTYIVPPPQITSFTPTSGSLDTIVTITGQNFTGATEVNFGGIAASSFSVGNDSTITAIVGNGSTGNVLVRTPFGVDSLGTFTYNNPSPLITSFTPASGSLGDPVTIKGKFFTGVTLVSFGGAPATIISNTDSTISVTVGNGLTGSVLVKTHNGTTSYGKFTYTCNDPIPAITSNFRIDIVNGIDTLYKEDTLFSTPAKYYRWYFNNNRIDSANSRLLLVDQVGFYRAETSPDNVCWASSLEYPVVFTRSPLLGPSKMIMYPNPSSGKFNIDVKLPQTTGVIAYVTVYDVNGTVRFKTHKLTFFGDHIIIPVTLGNRGTFFVKVSINDHDISMQTIVIM